MKYHFLVNVAIEPDEDESREQMYERLDKALNGSTARDALAEACWATVELRLAQEAPPELIAKARAEYEDDDVEIDDHAAMSSCPDESYDWVAAWVNVLRE